MSNGVFWTMPIDPSTIAANPDTGRASLRFHDLPVPDFGDVVNALTGGPSKPGSVSLDCRWEAAHNRTSIRDTAERFQGDYVRNQATLRWSAHTEDFSFVADALESLFAEVGTSRNGVYFS